MESSDGISEEKNLRSETSASTVSQGIMAEKSEERDAVVKEVLKIKKVLINLKKEEEVVVELLGQLQRIPFTMDLLEATLIGKVVNDLRRENRTRPVGKLGLSLIKSWRNVVDGWVDSRVSSVGESSKSEAGSSVITEKTYTKDPQPSTSKSICPESVSYESDASTGRQNLNPKIDGPCKIPSKPFANKESEPLLGFLRPPVQRFPPIKPSTSKQSKPSFKGSKAGIRRQILPPSRLRNESESISISSLQEQSMLVQTLPSIEKTEEISIREMLERAKRMHPEKFPQAKKQRSE